MIVRLQLSYGQALQKTRYFNRQFAIGLASILTPLSMMALVLGFWRLGADLNLTGQFAISQGMFSHWQVWMAVAIVMQAVAIILSRYAHRDEYETDDLTV
jgi:hypothetical protein